MKFYDKQSTINWESFGQTKKHMILMYMYRVKTDLNNIEDYIETFRFREYKIEIDSLPLSIRVKSAEELKAMAYAAIGAKLK